MEAAQLSFHQHSLSLLFSTVSGERESSAHIKRGDFADRATNPDRDETHVERGLLFLACYDENI
ncbi:unnamed protein product, partial [Nesidiocoris tenuis]